MNMSTKRRTHFELRAALRDCKITQAELARACSVTPLTVWRWTSGRIVIPGYVWSILALLDPYEPDEADAILMGMPKEWIVEHEDVFPNGESYRQLVKLWHPDVTRRDTALEMAVIAEFKNF